MRVVSGSLKGRRFSPPKSFKARPTTDIAKESLFNILSNRFCFDDLRILDLFSGTGSLSYEFASRGCENITSVELNYRHYSFIKNTIKDFELASQIKAIKADVFKFVKKCDEQFDLIFADPPFDLANFDSVADAVLENNILTSDGIFILEHSDKKSFESHPRFIEIKKYGKVHFSFFK
jgi:16S rRNA (guanine(966)-N(2))-methyltransferase RsmD